MKRKRVGEKKKERKKEAKIVRNSVNSRIYLYGRKTDKNKIKLAAFKHLKYNSSWDVPN